MTREEAIEVLNMVEAHGIADEAKHMAIEALSEPSKVDFRTDESANIGTEANDLISRAEAIEALSRSSVYIWSTEQDLVAHSWAISILQSLPSADRPQGEWIKENIVLTSNPPQRQWHCSECGHLLRGYENLVLDNYCPNCGARMRGAE